MARLSIQITIDVRALGPFATNNDALAEWLRRVPAKYMGFPRESSNLSGVVYNFAFFPLFHSLGLKLGNSSFFTQLFLGGIF